jgi:hypothetical protein
MTGAEVAGLSVERIQAGLRGGEFSAVELAEAALQHAEAENPKTGAYLRFSPERALAAARRVDEKLAHGRRPRTAGGRSDRGEGRDPHGGPAHHLRIADAGDLYAALRRDGGDTPRAMPAG